jgi:hypothetical protein
MKINLVIVHDVFYKNAKKSYESLYCGLYKKSNKIYRFEIYILTSIPLSFLCCLKYKVFNMNFCTFVACDFLKIEI